MEMASSLLSTGGKTVTRMSSVAKRVRSGFRHADKPSFVSAFCQTNCGDVSPNVLGAFCIDTGFPCEFNHSTCGGKNEQCYGRGPGYVLLLIAHFSFQKCENQSHKILFFLSSIWYLEPSLLDI